MYLIRIDLNRSSRRVRNALADCQKMHSMIMELFGVSRQEGKVLYRLKDHGMQISVYLYAAIPVLKDQVFGCMKLVGQRDVTEWLHTMQNGKCMGFDLMTMPSKKVFGGGKNNQRRVLRTEDERLAWLHRKAEQNGFRIINTEEHGCTSFCGNHAAGSGIMHWDGYHYTGTLEVTDCKLFQQALQDGIGPGKAYGLGMLLLV